MGDRGNIIIKDYDEQVVLYTHHRGSALPGTLRKALERGKSRWDDPQYLARIIFCEMLGGDLLGTTGFGISQSVYDGEDQTITVDINAGTVEINGATESIPVFISSTLGF